MIYFSLIACLFKIIVNISSGSITLKLQSIEILLNMFSFKSIIKTNFVAADYTYPSIITPEAYSFLLNFNRLHNGVNHLHLNKKLFLLTAIGCMHTSIDCSGVFLQFFYFQSITTLFQLITSIYF